MPRRRSRLGDRRLGGRSLRFLRGLLHVGRPLQSRHRVPIPRLDHEDPLEPSAGDHEVPLRQRLLRLAEDPVTRGLPGPIRSGRHGL